MLALQNTFWGSAHPLGATPIHGLSQGHVERPVQLSREDTGKIHPIGIEHKAGCIFRAMWSPSLLIPLFQACAEL